MVGHERDEPAAGDGLDFSALVDRAGIPVAMADADGRLVRWSRGFEQLLGYRGEELCRLTFEELVHPDDREAVVGAMERVIGGAAPACELEVRYVAGGGDVVWLDLWMSAVRDAHGEVTAVVGAGVDVTASKRRALHDETRREELEINERLLEALLAADTEQEAHEALLAAAARLLPEVALLAVRIGGDGRTARIVAHHGLEGRLGELIDLIGADPTARDYVVTEIPTELSAGYRSGTLIEVPGGVHEVSFGAIDAAAAAAVEEALGVRSVQAVTYASRGTQFGALVLLRPAAACPTRRDALETAARQTAIAVQRLRAEAEVLEGRDRMDRALNGSIAAMGTVVEMRDPYTAGHERRVTALALAVAEHLGLDDDARRTLRLAGSVHDIGKIAIPAEILSKPGDLTEAESSIVQRHPRVGYDILSDIAFDGPVAGIVLQHHERLDGSGYPLGCGEGRILPEARILAVADVVEAMASHRPYRPAMGVEAALEEVARGRGTLYDAEAVDACTAVIHDNDHRLPE